MQTAIRLPPTFTKPIRDITNEVDVLTCFNSTRHSYVGAKFVDEIALLSDCRPFFSFIDSSFRKSAALFIKGGEVYGTVAQINKIYRSTHCFETGGFKTVQHDTVKAMFKMLSLLYKKK